MDVSRIVCTFITLFIVQVFTQEVTVSLTATQERPKVGEQLAITCTVSGTDLSTDAILFRKLKSDGTSVILADKNGGTSDVSEHWITFAFNTNTDGTIGGTLSLVIIGAMESDIGDYTCTITRDSFSLGEDRLYLDVLYVPNTSPLCQAAPFAQSTGNYYEGDIVTFSCSSAFGNPTVDLTWSRSDGQSLPAPAERTNNDFLFSESTLTMSVSDSGVTFTCTSSSNEFPEYQGSCSPGFISVVARPTTITTLAITTPSPSTTSQQSTTTTTTTITTTTSTASSSGILRTSMQPGTSKVLETSSTILPSSSMTLTSIEPLKIYVIVGGSVGFILLVITIISLYCLVRFHKCCSKEPKLVLPRIKAPNSYYNNVKLEPDLEMRQANNGDEGILSHVASSDGTLYAQVNKSKSRKSANSSDYGSSDDPPPYPGHDSEFDDSSQGGYNTLQVSNGPVPPVRSSSERLYEIPPIEDEEDDVVKSDQYASVPNANPSYYDDLESQYGTIR